MIDESGCVQDDSRNPLRAGGTGGLAKMLVLAVLIGGCQTPRPTSPQLDAGLIWMIPGIHGEPWMLADARRGLRDAGVESAIEVYDWKRPGLFGVLSNLIDIERNLEHAAKIAREIDTYYREHPGRPIDVVGYSGGGGLAILTVEALPQDVRLRHVILVQAAISPDYDLSQTLRQIDGTIINFHSEMDWVILGLGTQAFGTMDRLYVPSAGKSGFNLMAAVPDEALHGRVRQVQWTPKMMLAGHYGGHVGMLTYGWNRKYLAPYLMHEAQDNPLHGAPVEPATGRGE